MKTKTYTVIYSIQVNGEEYPRQLNVQASSKDDARKLVKDKVSPEVQITFTDVIPL
jgi:hypothetical protein